MKLNFAKEYNRHLASFKKNYLKNFEEDLKHAPNKQYFITIFQEKVKNGKSEVYRISNLHSKISEFDNALELDDRISMIELVTKFCKEEKRDLLQTLFYIAEIKSLDEIWLIAQRRRSTINIDEHTPPTENSHPTPITNSQIASDKEAKSTQITKSKNLYSEKLADIFSDNNKYNIIIQQLHEENFITIIPLQWNHQGKGNKLILCTLLYDLHKKGYYNLLTYPTPNLLQAIALNTFNLSISNRTFKDKDSIARLKHRFDFIKYSASI